MDAPARKGERMHAMKIYDSIITRGGKVTLTDIEAPKSKWVSAAKVFEDTIAHEQKVTGMINGLVTLPSVKKTTQCSRCSSGL